MTLRRRQTGGTVHPPTRSGVGRAAGAFAYAVVTIVLMLVLTAGFGLFALFVVSVLTR